MSRVRGSRETFRRPEGVSKDAVVSVFRVPPEVAGQRVDVFVQSHLKRTSRTRAQAIVRASAYDGDGRRLRVNDRVRPEQRVLLWRAPWDEAPVPLDVTVLYEDAHLLAIDKPANLPVHPTARYHRNTVIKLLQAARPDEFLSLGHRIDRETSGILLVARSAACDRALKRQLELREGVEKTYEALTWDVPRGAKVGVRFRFEHAVELDPTSPYKVKMRTSHRTSALHAATWFEVQQVARARGRTYARVRCDLETGRQHQIRVHLAALGAPIVGDKLYGPDETCFARGADGVLTSADLALLELPRHALHARRLSLRHPVTRESIVIESALPPDLRAFWDSLTIPEGPCRDRSDREPRG